MSYTEEEIHETEYKQIIQFYKHWEKKAEQVAELFLKLKKEDGWRWITLVDLNEDVVNFQTEEKHYDYPEVEWDSFPASWLWDKNWEAKAVALLEERKAKEEKEKQEKAEKERQQEIERKRKQYEQLKKEFGE